MQLRKLVIISALALALVPATSHAQGWFFTPFVGGNFGGNANFEDFNDFDDEVEKRIDFGATIGWNPSVVGFEFDFGWSPNFFENTVGDANFEFGDSNVTTFMGNVLISAPPGRGVRPPGAVGPARGPAEPRLSPTAVGPRTRFPSRAPGWWPTHSPRAS